MSRVDINDQVKIGHCTSIYGSTGEAKVDRQSQTTVFSVNRLRLRNWEELCDEIDRILVDYTRMISSFKVYYTFFMIATVFIGVVFLLPSFFDFYTTGTLSMYMPAVYLPLFFGFVYFAFKESSIWERVKGVCTAKSVNGVRYELLFERYGKVKTRYIMIHLLLDEEEGQNEQALNSIPAAPVGTSNQSNYDLDSSSSSSSPHPTVPAADATANGGMSLFDQLRS